MTIGKGLAIIVLSGCAICPSVRAADDIFQFYQEEAKVVSASRLPHAENQTPATVYVVTQEDIKASGAQNIWDALRNVPGVEVMETRTGQGEIGIRGINRALNSRTLILLDGQPVFNPYFDFLTWSSLPVGLDEIDRIEVVEGPASAVYGADALSGVVNIITKRPEQVNGTQVTYTGGERNTQIGSLNFGQKKDNLGIRFGAGWNSTDRFEDASRLGAQDGRFDGSVDYDFSKHSSLNLAGGYNNYQAEVADGIGTLLDKGQKNFVRMNYHFFDTLFKANWDHNRGTPEEEPLLQGTPFDYDSYETGLEQTVKLPFRNQAVFGGSYKHEVANSAILQDGRALQDFWSAFFEDKWDITEQWLLMGSGRVDHHPLTPTRFSPRGSLLFTPVPEHVFRVSAGSSYRNPDLIENYFNATFLTPNPGGPGLPPNPPFSNLQVQFVGNRDLDPESLHSIEIAHTGRFGRLNSTLTGYHWDYTDGVTLNAPVPNLASLPPTFMSQRSFANVQDQTHAWGSELGLDYTATEWLKLFTNYSYIYVYGVTLPIIPARHQVNTGIRTRYNGWTSQWAVNWVDKVTTTSAGLPDQNLPAYFLLNARVGYAFAGKLSGLEAAVNAFNLLNHDHFEYSPLQGAEIVKARLTGTLSYKF